MHDLKFANEIVSYIRKNIQKTGKPLPKNIVVDIRLSPLTHVTPEGLCETFKQIAEHEGLEGIKLNIKPLEFDVHCRACGTLTKSVKPIFNCPKCRSGDFDIVKEKEFVIDSVNL